MNWIIFLLIVYLIGTYTVFAFFTWYDTNEYTGLHSDVGLHIVFSVMWPFLAVTFPITVPFYLIYEWINKHRKNKL